MSARRASAKARPLKTASANAKPQKVASTKTVPAKRAAAKTMAVQPAPAKAAPAEETSVPSIALDGEATARALDLAGEIDRALASGKTDVLTTEALHALMAAVCRCYSAQVEAGNNFLPLAERSRVTSTDVMVTASGLLRSANLAVFELGMWQSWTGH